MIITEKDKLLGLSREQKFKVKYLNEGYPVTVEGYIAIKRDDHIVLLCGKLNIYIRYEDIIEIEKV